MSDNYIDAVIDTVVDASSQSLKRQLRIVSEGLKCDDIVFESRSGDRIEQRSVRTLTIPSVDVPVDAIIEAFG